MHKENRNEKNTDKSTIIAVEFNQYLSVIDRKIKLVKNIKDL